MSLKTATSFTNCDTTECPQRSEDEDTEVARSAQYAMEESEDSSEESDETSEDEDDEVVGYATQQYLVKKRMMRVPIIPKQCLFYEGTLFRIGDVVSITDMDDGIFYAQIAELQINEYSERCAVIQWLFPTPASPNPNEEFNPETYYLGFKEDFARSLICMDFVLHVPLGYFKTNSLPHPCEQFSYSRRG